MIKRSILVTSSPFRILARAVLAEYANSVTALAQLGRTILVAGLVTLLIGTVAGLFNSRAPLASAVLVAVLSFVMPLRR